MKEIKAYIKPHKLSEVTLALHKVEGLTGMTVKDARGFGRGRAKQTDGREHGPADYSPCAEIQIVCADKLAGVIVSAIEKAAHTGLRGDGKIYVSEVKTAVRISTGERGDAAV